MDMNNHPQPAGGENERPDALRAVLAEVASGIDTRFVAAGTALSQTYAAVEQLVTALERVTNAIDGQAATAAIDDMRATADRLIRLPALQDARAAALREVEAVSVELRDEIHHVHRMLSFLGICGMNIKVAAAGVDGFGSFADEMSTTLEIAEAEMDQISRDIEALRTTVPQVYGVERRLAEECAAVLSHVPTSLAEDAVALQRHQAGLADRAERIASVAREVRSQVATALGALQVGDITRQRIEHVFQGMDALDRVLGSHQHIGIDDVGKVRSHAMALLAAQTSDAAQDFQREVALLMKSLHEIGPSAAVLLELQHQTDDDPDDDHSTFLSELERSVAEAESVTNRLREADTQAEALGAATSATAEQLGQRLRNITRVKNDVQHMAWNTDLRCYRMGDAGRGLAVVASEIRRFATALGTTAGRIGLLFERLSGAAVAMRGQQDTGVTRSLAESLKCIHDGGDRMREGLSGLASDASGIAEMLRDTTDTLDCAASGTAMAEGAERLARWGAVQESFSDAAQAALRELFEHLSHSYTMAREREVHRRYSAVLGDDSGALAPTTSLADDDDDDDDDDGLF